MVSNTIQTVVLKSLVLFLGFAGGIPLKADTFSYDDAGRLLSSVSPSSGINHGYTYDEEANLLTITHSATDTATVGSGAGNGIPDWWELIYFGTRGVVPTASYANDGISNLMKYAFGLNPLVSVSDAPLTLFFQNYTDGQTYPHLEFTRLKEAAAMISLERSIDLMSPWQTEGSIYVTVSVTDLGDDTEYVVVRNLTSLADAPKVFFRLRVTAP